MSAAVKASRAVVGVDVSGGRIDDARKGAGDVDGSVVHVKEPRVVAAMPEEELVFEAGVGVHEGTALGLEDGADALVRGDDVETRKEVVVHQSNDALCGGEGLPEASIQCCIIITRFVECDERGGCGDLSGHRGETGLM